MDDLISNEVLHDSDKMQHFVSKELELVNLRGRRRGFEPEFLQTMKNVLQAPNDLFQLEHEGKKFRVFGQSRICDNNVERPRDSIAKLEAGQRFRRGEIQFFDVVILN